MLYCKKLDPEAIIPTVAHPGEDLGYDIYALGDVVLHSGWAAKVKTGISARFIDDEARYSTLGGYGSRIEDTYGLLLRDRSSMASKGITVSGGVIDAGYTGEIMVILTFSANQHDTFHIKKGDKIAQMIPVKVLTENGIMVTDNLPKSKRGEKGFGSSGV